VFGIAARFNVQVRAAASCALSLDRIVLAVLCQLLQLVKDFFVDQVALFHPTFGATFAADSHKTAVAFQHLDALSVLH